MVLNRYQQTMVFNSSTRKPFVRITDAVAARDAEEECSADGEFRGPQGSAGRDCRGHVHDRRVRVVECVSRDTSTSPVVCMIT